MGKGRKTFIQRGLQRMRLVLDKEARNRFVPITNTFASFTFYCRRSYMQQVTGSLDLAHLDVIGGAPFEFSAPDDQTTRRRSKTNSATAGFLIALHQCDHFATSFASSSCTILLRLSQLHSIQFKCAFPFIRPKFACLVTPF